MKKFVKESDMTWYEINADALTKKVRKGMRQVCVKGNDIFVHSAFFNGNSANTYLCASFDGEPVLYGNGKNLYVRASWVLQESNDQKKSESVMCLIHAVTQLHKEQRN